MPRQSLFMETTDIPASRTAGQVVGQLVEAGATQVVTDYGPDRKLIGLRFILNINNHPFQFRMPIRADAVFALLQSKRTREIFRAKHEESDREQAERVAWRQLLRWVEAQLAMIETGMAEAQEIFLPYMEQNGKTVYEIFTDTAFKRLPAPKSTKGTK